MIKMKALQSFTGQEGKVRTGREFEVATEARADDLVRQRMAERVVAKPDSTKIAPSFQRLGNNNE